MGLTWARCQALMEAVYSVLATVGQRRENLTNGSQVEIMTRRDRSPNTTKDKTGTT